MVEATMSALMRVIKSTTVLKPNHKYHNFARQNDAQSEFADSLLGSALQ